MPDNPCPEHEMVHEHYELVKQTYCRNVVLCLTIYLINCCVEVCQKDIDNLFVVKWL